MSGEASTDNPRNNGDAIDGRREEAGRTGRRLSARGRKYLRSVYSVIILVMSTSHLIDDIYSNMQYRETLVECVSGKKKVGREIVERLWRECYETLAIATA